MAKKIVKLLLQSLDKLGDFFFFKKMNFKEMIELWKAKFSFDPRVWLNKS